jgi:hypothetical protein
VTSEEDEISLIIFIFDALKLSLSTSKQIKMANLYRSYTHPSLQASHQRRPTMQHEPFPPDTEGANHAFKHITNQKEYTHRTKETYKPASRLIVSH